MCEMCIDTMRIIDFSKTVVTRSIRIVSVLMLRLSSHRASESAVNLSLPNSGFPYRIYSESYACALNQMRYTQRTTHLTWIMNEWDCTAYSMNEWMNEWFLWQMIKLNGKKKKDILRVSMNEISLDWIIFINEYAQWCNDIQYCCWWNEESKTQLVRHAMKLYSFR